MPDYRGEAGEAPNIRVDSVGGSLRVTGRPVELIEATGGGDAGLTVEEEGETLKITSLTNLTLFVPRLAALHIGTVGGDATITNLDGDLLLRTVGGDLRLKNVGEAAVESVGGDLAASKLGGAFSADQVGGVAQVDASSGAVRLRSIGGDLQLSRAVGLAEVAAGGDAILDLTPPAGSRSAIQVGGDCLCVLPEGASLAVQVSAGGDLRLAVSAEIDELVDGHRFTLGAGEAELALHAGGDLTVRTGGAARSDAAQDLGEAIAARVGAEVEAQMAEVEARLSGLGESIQGFDSERIVRKINQAVAKAQTRAAKARRKAAQRVAGMGEPSLGGLSQGSAGAASTEQERLLILKMVESGKLTVDQAAQLLDAMEGQG